MPRALTTIALTLALTTSVRAGSSSSLLDVSPDGSRLLVANTDNGTVTVVDLKTRQPVCELAVGDHTEAASWVGAGPLAIVTAYGDDTVAVIDADQRRVVATIPVPDEPYGVVTTRNGQFAYVTHDHPGAISEIDLTARKVTRTFPVGEACRGLALSNDEKTLYATEFFTANLVAVNRATGQVVDRWAGHSQDNLARHVVLHPTRPKAYVSHIRSRVTAFDARGSIFPQLTFYDLDKPATEKRFRSLALDTYNNVRAVTNPWEAALSPDGTKIYTIYAGTDDMNVSQVLDENYQEVDRIGSAVNTGKHPRAVRTSPDGREVYVYNTLDYSVGVYSADLRKLTTMTVCKPPHSVEWRRGKELFQTALQPMGSARWIACSSCHPDGLTDGRVWQNPEGHRKTPHLFGLAHTHPLHWSADRDESQDFEYTVRGKLMQGRGLARGAMRQSTGFTDFAALDEVCAGKSADLDALAVYTNSFPVRLSPHVPAPGKLSAEAERGRKLFFAAETKCATCHTGPYFTDGQKNPPFVRHNVGTGDGADEKIGPNYDTPSLLGLYKMRGFLHDGRAKTLHDVLTVHNKGDKHGTTSHLSATEANDLVAFLKSLPYEALPERTPNTVKYFEPLKPVTAPK